MSVAPNSRARFWRVSCRDIAMIRDAPSRDAASTAQSPTAPSPTTTTVLPSVTPAETAAWWPVPITSARVRRLGTSASDGYSGVATSEPSACGTRTRWPCAPSAKPPSRSSAPHHPPCRHEVLTPFLQLMQVMSQS